MITAIFETGQLTGGTKYGANALIVVQVGANSFAIENTRGETVAHNFCSQQQACEVAAELSTVYTLI